MAASAFCRTECVSTIGQTKQRKMDTDPLLLDGNPGLVSGGPGRGVPLVELGAQVAKLREVLDGLSSRLFEGGLGDLLSLPQVDWKTGMAEISFERDVAIDSDLRERNARRPSSKRSFSFFHEDPANVSSSSLN